MELAEYMNKHGLTDASFAKAVNRDRSTVTRWRLKLTRPEWDAIEAIELATNRRVTARDFVWNRGASE